MAPLPRARRGPRADGLMTADERSALYTRAGIIPAERMNFVHDGWFRSVPLHKVSAWRDL